MLLQPDYQCHLTQSDDVAISERIFLTEVYLNNSEEALQYKQIDQTEYERLKRQQDALAFEPTAEYYQQLDEALDVAKAKVNETEMTSAEALAVQEFFPVWGEEGAEFGKDVPVGFRLRVVEGETDTLYETIQAHKLQADWKPGAKSGTLALYKVVEAGHAGTLEDPIPWAQGMEVENGKYYTDQGVTYKGIRDTGMPMAYDLKDLVSGGFVEVVEEETEDDGTAE